MYHYTTPQRFILSSLYLLFLITPLSAQSTKKFSEIQALCIASRTGNFEKVKTCLRKNPTLANQQFVDPTSQFMGNALHYAVGPKSKKTNMNVLTYLIDNGCSLKSLSNSDDSPLQCALRFDKNVKTIAKMIDGGSSLMSQNKFGATPLHTALYSGKVESIELLLVNDAPLDIINKKGFPAEYQTPNPKIANNSKQVTFIRQLVHYARLFHDAEDKIAFIANPVDTHITPKAQELGFKTLVETCELKSLITLHEELMLKNPKFFKALLVTSGLLKPKKQKKTIKKVEPKKPELSYENTKSFYALLCKHWLKMPQKIAPYIETGKLDGVLEHMRISIPSTKKHSILLLCICKRLNEINLYKMFKVNQNADLGFSFK